MRTILMRLAAMLAAVALPLAATAEGLPQGQHSLIRLQSRVFDLGTDVRRIRRDPHFIPITRIDWIWALTDNDPYLHATVIHIKSYAHFPGEPIWWPDQDRARFAPAPDLADAWALDGYDVRWDTRIAPSTRGGVRLFPKSSEIKYYVSCGYDRKDQVPTFCAAHVLYPPDPNLRILIRVYKITDPLNDFRAVVGRALNLVYCLDVTEQVGTVAWRPSPTDRPADLAGYAATCKEVHS